jgi:7-cyano-7-deazaguanine synthase
VETKIFCLLSGGLDSSVALGMLIDQHAVDHPESVVAISIDYGQRHVREIQAAIQVAEFYDCEHRVMNIEGIIPPSMLTDKQQELPNASYADLPEGISPTYVPFRNGLMLSVLAAAAQGWVRGGGVVFAGGEHFAAKRQAIIGFGAHAEDAENWAYPDCTPEFIGTFGAAVFIGTYQKVRLVAPLMQMTKRDIVQMGVNIGAPLAKTWSCYAGGEKHCGTCPTCRARKDAFHAADVKDPTEYAA